MLYKNYQLQDDLQSPLRFMAKLYQSALTGMNWGSAENWKAKLSAGMELMSRFEITHVRPEFGIDSVRVGNREVAVTTETVLDLPFGKLLRFAKDIDTRQPRVLLLAPLSGHFATLLTGTIKTLLRDHEVFVTDWANARDVSLENGSFGVDDYVTYIIRFRSDWPQGTPCRCLPALCASRGRSCYYGGGQAPFNASFNDSYGWPG